MNAGSSFCSAVFGHIYPHPDGCFERGRANLWRSDPQLYLDFGPEPLPVLFYGELEDDREFLKLAESAHGNMQQLSAETVGEIAERLLSLCRDFDLLTGITSDTAYLRDQANLPPWVVKSIELADRIAMIKTPSDIWSFVQATEVLYGRIPDTPHLCAKISFRSDWDVEHGAQVVLSSGRTIYAVGPQDGFPL